MEHAKLGSACDGRITVSLATPTVGSRAQARVEIEVYGARYPYKLAAEEARELGTALLRAAEQLDCFPSHAPVS